MLALQMQIYSSRITAFMLLAFITCHLYLVAVSQDKSLTTRTVYLFKPAGVIAVVAKAVM